MTTQTAPSRRFKIPFKLKALTTAGIAAYGCYHFRYNPLPDVIALVKYAVDRDGALLSDLSAPAPVQAEPQIKYVTNETVRYIVDFDGIAIDRVLPKGVVQTLEGDFKGLSCLVKNAYHEARGQSAAEQAAVTITAINRKHSGEFASDLCGVVYQKNERTCEFSWTCDGLSDAIRDRQAFEDVFNTVVATLNGDYPTVDAGQTFFCNRSKSKCEFHERELIKLGKICVERIGGSEFCRTVSAHDFYTSL